MSRNKEDGIFNLLSASNVFHQGIRTRRICSRRKTSDPFVTRHFDMYFIRSYAYLKLSLSSSSLSFSGGPFKEVPYMYGKRIRRFQEYTHTHTHRQDDEYGM